MLRITYFLLLSLFLFYAASAQTAPDSGLRENTPAVFAFTNADIVTAPGRTINGGTMVVRDGIIEAIGRRVNIPADAWVYDLTGAMIYPGFIDLFSHYGLPDSINYEDHIHWNPHIRSHVRAAEYFKPDPAKAKVLRSQGFVAVQTNSRHGLLSGTSVLVSLGDTEANRQIVMSDVSQGISFRPAERRVSPYPSSLMGAVALIRQTMLDAGWYDAAHKAFHQQPGLSRPEKNAALGSLAGALNRNSLFIIDTEDENGVLRASSLATEFGLNVLIMGSGKEYRRADAIRNTGLPVILPLNFPEPPDVEKPETAMAVSLEDLRHWYLAPENPARMAEAGIPMALSAHGKEEGFLKNLQQAVQRGLSPEQALAALTTMPAAILGIDHRYGSLERGKAASFFITDGPVFTGKGAIKEVWIDGVRYRQELPHADVRGRWEVFGQALLHGAVINIEGQQNRLRGTVELKEKSAALEQISYDNHRLSFRFTGDSLGLEGVYRLSAHAGETELLGAGEDASGNFFSWMARKEESFPKEKHDDQPEHSALSLPERMPSMEYGITAIPQQPRHVLIRNATIWTQSEAGILENADMIVTRGVITQIGHQLSAPSGAVIVDAAGKHLTPGLIDPHLHTSILGGVNETGSAITSETRITDVLHGDNVWIYRLLAGGITSATLFHGSANPVGGQHAIIKMRWGGLPEALLIEDAAPGLKFALGENVKGMRTRYPNTRQGTEQIIRDAFLAALEYEKARQRQAADPSGMPVRRDLRLEAILEVIRGERRAHVHAYRQDEMLMMLRLAEEFGFTIASFEHTLEGYKIADELKEHGAAAVVWTDWSSFKVEAKDGILYNARLLNEVGVLTSLHSDNTQLSTRMNWEAAKVMKTGVSETDALHFITLNPARIMGIDHRTGSLEIGKDADFVIWTGHPLSGFSIPLQTWVDGIKYFDREHDRILRSEVQEERAVIINHLLNQKKNNTR